MQDETDTESVRLTIPAVSDYVRVARLAMSGIASRLGFTYDDIEDLRIVVDEVCSELVDDDSTGTVTVAYRVRPDSIEAEFEGEPAAKTGGSGNGIAVDVSGEVIRALVDEYERVVDGATVRARVHKRLAGDAD